MNKLKLTIYFLLLIPIMLIDPHISELINTFFTSETHISIFLFFIFIFYLSQQIGYFIAFPLSLILGMIYDYYYFDYLGIMVIAFPVSISFLYIFTKYLEKNSKI
ncbi:rod shape-determining protein MreD, partial [Streptococcus parauberis]